MGKSPPSLQIDGITDQTLPSRDFFSSLLTPEFPTPPLHASGRGKRHNIGRTLPKCLVGDVEVARLRILCLGRSMPAPIFPPARRSTNPPITGISARLTKAHSAAIGLRRMSGVGHFRHFERTPATSAVPSKADIRLRCNICRGRAICVVLHCRKTATDLPIGAILPILQRARSYLGDGTNGEWHRKARIHSRARRRGSRSCRNAAALALV